MSINFTSIYLSKSELYKEILSYGNEYKWIKYGKDDNYDRYLIELQNKSGLHKGILDRKVKLDVSDGFDIEKIENPKQKKFYQLLSDSSFLKYVFTDLELFGGSYILVSWLGDKIGKIDYIPFQKCRLGEPNEEDVVDTVYVCNNWKKYKKDETQSFPIFTGEKKDDVEIMPLFNYVAGFRYPMASYVPDVNWIESDWEVSNFHLNNIKNGFNPGAILVFKNGKPSPQEEEHIKTEIKKGIGSDGAGKYLIYFVDDATQTPDVKQLEVSNLDKQFEFLSTKIDDKIITGHQIPRILAGLETQGSLGDSKQMVDSNEVFYNNYIIYQQNLILDGLNKINSINKWEDVEIKRGKTPLTYLMLSDYKDYLTREEIRGLIGFEAEEDEIEKKRLIQILGIGGMTEMLGIIKDPELSTDMKKSILQIGFGLRKKQLEMLFPIIEEPKINPDENGLQQ